MYQVRLETADGGGRAGGGGQVRRLSASCARCLEHDPETTNEGQVCQKMNDFLETLYLSHA